MSSTFKYGNVNTKGITVPATKSSKINIGITERLISITSGLYLIYSGIRNLKKTPVRSIRSLFSGSFLLYRGISGYCPARNIIKLDAT